ncbi:transmembrane protein 225B isoform X3 [Hippopotamus amphibius kiboko]|uniref:transmembrane protein 225B isoform X3 n=1 Tax=Hippopotamus amphibius kiboko TaxID=575201 RepID=UPI002595C98C|nr:transmembrane protein 225B isoform X3 [Hippopotamus amphibius kiboko]
MAELEFEFRSGGLRVASTPALFRAPSLSRACEFLSFFIPDSPHWPKLGMGRPVMLTLEDKDMKGFTWAIAPALTSLGYLLILLVSVFPFWVRLVNEESQEVFFSGLFENCFHIKCWKPRPLSVSIILGRVFLLSAVILSFLTTFIMVSFAAQLFPRTRKHNFVSAFVSFLTGACAFLALLLHALEMQSLRMKPSPLQLSVQWPYYVLGFGILLFIVAGAICLVQETACLSCHLLPISQSTEETQEILHLENLESLGGELSSIQKETLMKEETII